jgi:hypothetical protein
MTSPEDPAISLSSTVVADSRQISADVDRETLVLNLETGGYYSLSRVGAEIWKLLASPIRVSEIGDTLVRRYGIPRAQGEADLLDLLGELQRRGLVRVVPAGRGTT